MSRSGKRRRGRNGPAFVQLYCYLLDSRAWHQLSLAARSAYIELARPYNGANNGRLALSARRLARQMPCSKDTAAKVLRELEDVGFIEATKIGCFTRKEEERRASEYRLTCFRCDATGDLPTRKFDPNVRWDPSERPTKSDGSVSPNWKVEVKKRPTVRPNRAKDV
jgi:hypothetical protein